MTNQELTVRPECNIIADTIKKIDKIQKDVLSDNTYTCINCETALISTIFNTIPISLYTCCSSAPIIATIGVDGDTTQYFRIESVRCDRFVTLRLLEATGEDPTTLVGTDYTMT